MAEHMFKKSMSSLQIFTPGTAESLADVLFEIGEDFLNKLQYENAVKWLGRAYEVIDHQELDKMSTNISELNLSITDSLIKANLALKTPDATDKARAILDTIEQTMGDRLVVYILRLEILSSTTNENFDSASYANTLHKMACSMILSEPNFKLIMHHIRRLNDKSPSCACNTLDSFIRMRLLSEVKEVWLEKVVITRIWMTVNQRDSIEVLDSLKTILSDISNVFKNPASSAVTLAAHTVPNQPLQFDLMS